MSKNPTSTLDKETIIKTLEEKISKAQSEYYNIHDDNNKTLTVSDKVYDAWIDTLAMYDPQNKLLLKVGAEPISNWEKHVHTHPMLSLDKAQSNEQYLVWHNKYIKNDDLFVTLKLDGLSAILEYEDGKLIRGCTRGAGLAGEDITKNILKMQGIPHRLPKRINAIVRGEILISKENHQKYFPDYSNPRNAASGICRRYDGTNCDKLFIMCYELDCEDIKSNSYEEMFNNLKHLNFTCPPHYICKSHKEVIDLKDQYASKLRDEFEFLLDGIVIHINGLERWYSLGYNEHHPYGSVAFKFEAPCKETTLLGIEWTTGNSGRITPVALLKPIVIDGVEIKKATLHNVRMVEELELYIGCKVLVSRRNDVTPYIEEKIS